MAVDKRIRCGWAGTPILQAYHDEEWGVPVHDDRSLFESLVLDGFQAGLSWAIVLRKRNAFRKAFDNFEIKKVARYRDSRVERCRYRLYGSSESRRTSRPAVFLQTPPERRRETLR